MNVFLAYSDAAALHADRVREAVAQVGKRTAVRLGIPLILFDWRVNPAIAQVQVGHIQATYDERVRNADVFLCVLGPFCTSGTIHEIGIALGQRARTEIMIYSLRAPDPIPRRDAAAAVDVDAFLRDLAEKGVDVRRYESPEDLQRLVSVELYDRVVGFYLRGDQEEANREKAWRTFFRFGKHVNEDAEARPRVTLAYPAVHDVMQDAYDWRERLVPNVVYEDFKCIQKIETAVRQCGATIRSVTTDQPALGEEGNRIWLCIPRNELAQNELKTTLRSQVGFSFEQDERASVSDRPLIRWHPDKTGDPVLVRSPLSQYLASQRPAEPATWRHWFGNIVARDYAVIARVPDLKREHLARAGSPFYQYFVAGIRGLGTWGAGWYIKYHYDELATKALELERKQEPVQLLLEVTFSRYRIRRVRVVNERDQGYFDDQLSEDTIQKRIEQFIV